MTDRTIHGAGAPEPGEPPLWMRIGAMNPLPARQARWVVRQVTAVALQAVPDGGQSVARRNAREAIAVNRQLAAARHQASVAVEAAAASAELSAAVEQARPGSASGATP